MKTTDMKRYFFQMTLCLSMMAQAMHTVAQSDGAVTTTS